MRRFRVIIVVLMTLIKSSSVFAQEVVSDIRLETVPAVPIQATFEQTTTLLFPFDVLSVDWGSAAIILQQRKGVKNILHVKAAKNDFVPTNLSVVTSDGQFYSFIVRFAKTPSMLTYVVHRGDAVALATVPHNMKGLARIGQRVLDAPDFLNVSSRSAQVRVGLKSLYVADEKLWMKLKFTNYSLLDMTLRDVHFIVKNSRGGKQRVVQEKEVIPVYAGDAKVVLGKSMAECVFGFDPFAVAKGKRVVVRVSGKANGRLVELKVRRGLFRKLRRLPTK